MSICALPSVQKYPPPRENITSAFLPTSRRLVALSTWIDLHRHMPSPDLPDCRAQTHSVAWTSTSEDARPRSRGLYAAFSPISHQDRCATPALNRCVIASWDHVGRISAGSAAVGAVIGEELISHPVYAS